MLRRFATVLLLLWAVATPVMAEAPTYNGYPTVLINFDAGAYASSDVPAIIMNGHTLVPLRFIAENLGAKVNWDPANRVVTIYHPDVLKPASSNTIIDALQVENKKVQSALDAASSAVTSAVNGSGSTDDAKYYLARAVEAVAMGQSVTGSFIFPQSGAGVRYEEFSWLQFERMALDELQNYFATDDADAQKAYWATAIQAQQYGINASSRVSVGLRTWHTH